MTDYLEELLEDKRETGELPQSQPHGPRRKVNCRKAAREGAPGRLPRGGSRGDAGTGENPTTGCAGPPPLSGEARGTGTRDGGTRRVREAVSYEEKKGQNPPVSFADSPLSKGAKGSAVEALVGKLRKGAMAAAYRASAPAAVEIPERSYVREQSLLALDTAFRRDARRYDGGFELF